MDVTESYEEYRRVFWERLEYVSRKFQGFSWKCHGRRSFKNVSRVFHDFQGCFKKVSMGFQEICLDVTWKFYGVSTKFQEIFRVFQKSFMLHGTHRSFPSRRRALSNKTLWIHSWFIKCFTQFKRRQVSDSCSCIVYSCNH